MMSEIKSRAFSLCVILIVTGVFMRLLPERSNKKTVKFVVTLILIVTVLNFDISSVGNALSFDFSGDNSDAVGEYESGLKDKIAGSVYAELEEKVAEIYKEYDENAVVQILSGGDRLKVIIIGTHLSDSEKEKAQSRAEAELGGKAEFIYRER